MTKCTGGYGISLFLDTVRAVTPKITKVGILARWLWQPLLCKPDGLSINPLTEGFVAILACEQAPGKPPDPPRYVPSLVSRLAPVSREYLN